MNTQKLIKTLPVRGCVVRKTASVKGWRARWLINGESEEGRVSRTIKNRILEQLRHNLMQFNRKRADSAVQTVSMSLDWGHFFFRASPSRDKPIAFVQQIFIKINIPHYQSLQIHHHHHRLDLITVIG